MTPKTHVALLNRGNVVFFPHEKLPAIVLSDRLATHETPVYSLVTELWTQSDVNHSMILSEPGHFATQDSDYHRAPVVDWLDNNHRLELYTLNLPSREVQSILYDVERDLDLPRFFRRYDWTGIIGQILRLHWLNIPYLYYCSERVAKHLRRSAMLAAAGLPKRPCPGELKIWFQEHQDLVPLYGIYDPRFD